MKRKLSLQNRIAMTLSIVLAVSNLVGCNADSTLAETGSFIEISTNIDIPQVDTTTLFETNKDILEPATIEEATPILETHKNVDLPQVDVTTLVETNTAPIQVEEVVPINEVSLVENMLVATTKNIEFTFHETQFDVVKQVPLHMVNYFPSDENGNLTEGFYAIFTTISYKNLSSESQTFMTNSTTIRSLDGDEPSSLIHEIRYFSKMDTTKKLSMQYTLAPNEEVTFDVAFCIADFFYPINSPKVIVINPDGTNPINENARVIPISLSL